MKPKLQEISKETIELAKNKYPFSYSSSAPEFREPLNVPVQEELQKWLREEHGIRLFCHPSGLDSIGKYWDSQIYIGAHCEWSSHKVASYEDALEDGLQKGLELI